MSVTSSAMLSALRGRVGGREEQSNTVCLLVRRRQHELHRSTVSDGLTWYRPLIVSYIWIINTHCWTHRWDKHNQTAEEAASHQEVDMSTSLCQSDSLSGFPHRHFQLICISITSPTMQRCLRWTTSGRGPEQVGPASGRVAACLCSRARKTYIKVCVFSSQDSVALNWISGVGSLLCLSVCAFRQQLYFIVSCSRSAWSESR